MRRVLSLAAYRRLLVAYTLNELAFAVTVLTLSFLVYRRTGSALGATGFYLCAQFAPAFISPFLVARLSGVPARTALPALYTAEAAIFVVLGMLARHFSVGPVLALVLLDGILALAARPIARATTVAVTSREGLLREGNAVTNGCFTVAFMVGPAAAGAVVATSGASRALYANAVLFALIALTLVTGVELPAPAEQGAGRVWQRLRAAAAHARDHAGLRTLIGVQALAVVFFTVSMPVEVVLAQHTLHAGAGGYGALLSAWGAGAVAGSIVYARWHSAPARALISLATAMIGIGMLIMGLAPTLTVAIAGGVVAGVGNGVEAVAARTAVQEQTREEWMALMMSFNDSLAQAVPGLGIVLGGGLTALAGPRAALAVAGVASIFVALGAWVLLQTYRPVLRTASEPPVAG